MTSRDDRERRADERRQRREGAADQGSPTAGQDAAPQEGDAEADDVQSAGEEGSSLRTGATLAAAGALAGVAVGAASAVRSRRSSRGDADADSGPESLAETEIDADPRSTAEPQAEELGAAADHTEAEDVGDLDHSDDEADTAEGRTADTGETDAEDDRTEARAEPEPGSAASVVRRARDQLAELTGRESEGVLGFERTENGWLVQVELVELKRIPSTTDVLGVYDVELDDNGTVHNYHRTNRYVRSQGGGGA